MNYKEMSKEELIEIIEDLKKQLESKSNGRKKQVLDLIRSEQPINIIAIAERLNISTKNVSSQLTYLRQEGINICTDTNGKKFIVE